MRERKAGRSGSGPRARSPKREMRVKAPRLDPASIPIGNNRITHDLFHGLCKLSDSAFCADAYMAYHSADWLWLATNEPDPRDYEDPRKFAVDRQLSALFSKRADLPIGADRRELAYKKWLEAEASCARVNQLFRDRWDGISYFPPHIEQVLSLARGKIGSILGDFRAADEAAFVEHCHFGPGSDLSTRGSNTAVYDKYTHKGSITPWALRLADELFGNEESSDHRLDLMHSSELHKGSRLSFVPKKALIDRSIDVGPRWNVFLQLGLGGVLADRLRRVKIDITDQTRNQRLAKRAQSDGFATIDLSSASDCVSVNLVIDLLSTADERWLDLLLGLRTPYTKYMGRWIRLEKIAGMGNGYTFPLETLIFYSIASSAMTVAGCKADEEIQVYGDDIIVPKKSAALVIEALSAFGFQVNTSKTFVDGNFYESCGEDYFEGKNVRPFFLRKEVETLREAYALVNQIASLSGRLGYCLGAAWRPIWYLRDVVLRRIPAVLRRFGPPEAGDGVIHSSLDVALPFLRKAGNGWAGYFVPSFADTYRGVRGYSYYGHLYSKLHGTSWTDLFVSRRGYRPWVRREVYVLTYTEFVLVDD